MSTPYENAHTIVPDTFESINVKYIAGGNTGVTTTLFYNGLTGSLTLGDATAGITGEIDTTGGLVKSAQLQLTNHIKLNTSAGTSGQVLTSGGENAVPTWTTPPTVDTSIIDDSTNAVTNNAVHDALALKANLSSPILTGTVDIGTYAKVRNNPGTETISLIGQTGQVWAASFHGYSDDRIKSRTADISNATEMLLKLKPVKYEKHINLKVDIGVEDTDLSGVEHETEMGFNAQDVQKIPELAFIVKEHNDLLSLNYMNLISVLTKSIQELNERIKILENKS